MGAPMDIDSLLAREMRSDRAALDRALHAAREELALKRPVRRWTTQAAWVFAASSGLAGLVAAALFILGQVSASALLAHALLLVLLWATSAVCSWGALSPRGQRARLVGVGMAMASAAALVLARGSIAAESSVPGWVCTASHVGMAVVPIVMAVIVLRTAAFEPLRALAAGLAAGTTGAFLGELACAQGWRHVAAFHLSAWAIVAVATLAVSKSLEPRSFAP
jgi:hypothetical protein